MCYTYVLIRCLDHSSKAPQLNCIKQPRKQNHASPLAAVAQQAVCHPDKNWQPVFTWSNPVTLKNTVSVALAVAQGLCVWMLLNQGNTTTLFRTNHFFSKDQFPLSQSAYAPTEHRHKTEAHCCTHKTQCRRCSPVTSSYFHE